MYKKSTTKVKSASIVVNQKLVVLQLRMGFKSHVIWQEHPTFDLPLFVSVFVSQRHENGLIRVGITNQKPKVTCIIVNPLKQLSVTNIRCLRGKTLLGGIVSEGVDGYRSFKTKFHL